MSSLFAKARRKGLPKRLRKALIEFASVPDGRRAKEILPTLNAINETMNGEEFIAQGLPEEMNKKLYRDDTVKMLIKMLPFFDQPTMNAISTLLQTTVREFIFSSLPNYLTEHKDVLDCLVGYFSQQQDVSNLAHIIFRACIKSREFMTYLYEIGIVGAFIQNLSGENFDRLATAFGTYEALLCTHPDIASEHVTKNWELFHLQFKQLLSSPNYLVQLNFLPILIKFLTLQECRSLFMKFIEDVGNLQPVVLLLTSTSKRVQNNAYSLFKLFVINPRRADVISSALRRNGRKLIKLLNELSLDTSDQEFEDERRQVIASIEGLL